MFNWACGLWSWWWDSRNQGENFSRVVLPILITTFLVFWFFLWNVKKSKKASATLPPGPGGLPIVGFLPFLATDLHKQFTELARVYGPIYKLSLGSKLCVVVSSPSLAKEVVRDQDTTFANRDPPIVSRIVTYGANDIGWSSYGPDWKKLRKLFVRQMLSNASLDACYGLRKQEVKKAIRDVFNQIGKPIDIGELAFVTNINAIMSMLWGGTLEGEEGTNAVKEFRNSVAELLVIMGKPNASEFFPVLARLDLQGIERQTKKIFAEMDELMNFVIERSSNLVEANKARTEKNEQRKDFLQLLLELKESGDNATSITRTQIKGILHDILVGGIDTSTMVEWTIAELMRHQEIMKKVHQELDQIVGLNNCVEEFHLPNLHYLHSVVKETLRLHPALPLLVPHCPSKTSTIGGYTIPMGTRVFLNAYAMHRDPQLWDNPLEFHPERFLNEQANKFDLSGNNFKYLPFGSGRRVCAGLPLAEKMLMYDLASLLHSFEWKLPNDTKLELSDKFGIVVKKLKPLVAIPTPRLSNLDLYKKD